MSNKPHFSCSKFTMNEKEFRLSGWFSPAGLWNEELSKFDRISPAQEATIREAVNILAKNQINLRCTIQARQGDDVRNFPNVAKFTLYPNEIEATTSIDDDFS